MANPSPGSTILVIEDSDIVRELSANLLRNQGYHVVEAVDGMSGLVAAQHQSPDLIILDLHLPDMSGVEVANLIHEAIPFIVLTIDGHPDKVKACIDRGALGYLLKPPKNEDLLHQVQMAIAQGRARGNLRCAIQKTQRINKALGILMVYSQLSERGAYDLLIARSTALRVKVADLADDIIQAWNQLSLLGRKEGVSVEEGDGADAEKAYAFLNGFKSVPHQDAQ